MPRETTMAAPVSFSRWLAGTRAVLPEFPSWFENPALIRPGAPVRAFDDWAVNSPRVRWRHPFLTPPALMAASIRGRGYRRTISPVRIGELGGEHAAVVRESAVPRGDRCEES